MVKKHRLVDLAHLRLPIVDVYPKVHLEDPRQYHFVVNLLNIPPEELAPDADRR